MSHPGINMNGNQRRKKVLVTVKVIMEGPVEWVDLSSPGLVNADRPSWQTETKWGVATIHHVERTIEELPL